MSSDMVTEALRLTLMLVAFAAAYFVPRQYRRAHDTNPIPWTYLTVILAVYGVMMAVFLAGSDLVIEDWWRSLFSVLNINVIAAGAWVRHRAVMHRGG